MLCDLGDEIALTNDNATLGSAKQFVPAEQHYVGACRNAISRNGLTGESEASKVDCGSRTDIIDHRQVMALAELNEFFQTGLGGETGYQIVTWVDPQQRTCLVGNCPFIIFDACLIGGADLSQDCSTDFHDFGQTVAASNFHQVAA